MSLKIRWVDAVRADLRNTRQYPGYHIITHHLISLWRYIGCYRSLYWSSSMYAREIGEELAVANDKLQECSDESLIQFDPSAKHDLPSKRGRLLRSGRIWLAEVVDDFLSSPGGAKVEVWK